MVAKIDEKINKLKEKKKELEIKKKIIDEKEKRKLFKKKEKLYIEIGRMAERAEIFDLDKEVLLGAFLEISEKIKSDDQVKIWKEKGKNRSKEKNDQTPLSISFLEDPRKEEKSLMKEISFQYNKFRNEFYGYGDFEKIQDLVKNFQCKVEKIKA